MLRNTASSSTCQSLDLLFSLIPAVACVLPEQLNCAAVVFPLASASLTFGVLCGEFCGEEMVCLTDMYRCCATLQAAQRVWLVLHVCITIIPTVSLCAFPFLPFYLPAAASTHLTISSLAPALLSAVAANPAL